jgi:hypothetical protein
MLAAGRHEQKRFPAPQWLGDSYEKNVTHLSILQPLVRRTVERGLSRLRT